MSYSPCHAQYPQYLSSNHANQRSPNKPNVRRATKRALSPSNTLAFTTPPALLQLFTALSHEAKASVAPVIASADRL